MNVSTGPLPHSPLPHSPLHHSPSCEPLRTPIYQRDLNSDEADRLDILLHRENPILVSLVDSRTINLFFSANELNCFLQSRTSLFGQIIEPELFGGAAGHVVSGCSFGDIDLRIRLNVISPEGIHRLIISFFQNIASKITNIPLKSVNFKLHIAPDLSNICCQLGSIDLIFKSIFAPEAPLSFSTSNGFIISLNRRSVYCIDQITPCSSLPEFEEALRLLIARRFPVTDPHRVKDLPIRLIYEITKGFLLLFRIDFLSHRVVR